MTFEIKTPTRVDHWLTSEGKSFGSEEDARIHEVFLAVNPHVKKTAFDRYGVIAELARKFDFVPRGTTETPTGRKHDVKCIACSAPVFGTSRPGGGHMLTCLNGHDNGGLK